MHIIRILLYLIAQILVLSFSVNKLSVAETNFKAKASKSIKSVFDIDNNGDFSLMKSDTKDFYLYTNDLKGKSPLVKINCNKSSSFNIVSKSKNRPGGIASIGIINIGLCDSGHELKIDVLKNQIKMHDLFQSILLKSGRNIDMENIIQYRSKTLNSSLSMMSFTITIFGHGAMISPTAIITSNKSTDIVVLQFLMPPNCELIEDNSLTICNNLEKTFEIISLSLLNKNT